VILPKGLVHFVSLASKERGEAIKTTILLDSKVVLMKFLVG